MFKFILNCPNGFIYRSSDSARQGQNNSFKSGSSVPVSTSFNNDYQVLNPHQLYPTHVNQGASRAKLNYNKPSVYKQDNDCRYGVSSFKIHHPLIIISYSTLRNSFYSNLAIFAIHTAHNFT